MRVRARLERLEAQAQATLPRIALVYVAPGQTNEEAATAAFKEGPQPRTILFLDDLDVAL